MSESSTDNVKKRSIPESNLTDNRDVLSRDVKPKTHAETDTKKRNSLDSDVLSKDVKINSCPESLTDNTMSLSYSVNAKNVISKMRTHRNIPLDIVEDISCQMLVLITNNVKKNANMNSTKGLSHTSVNYVPLKILTKGYFSAPYEAKPSLDKSRTQINPKHRLYTDKDGIPLPEYKPESLCSLEVVNGEKIALFKSYSKHPNSALKNTCRGVPTDVIGAIVPGVPLSSCIFDDAKLTIMQDETTEESLCEFSFAIFGIRIRASEQCANGYGIQIKSIKALPLLNPGVGIYYPYSLLYNDKEQISSQSSKIIKSHKYTKNEAGDFNFIFRVSEKDDVIWERPLVVVECNNTNNHTIREQANNGYLELVVDDEKSIYNSMCFNVHIHNGAFAMPVTPFSWICQYYKWCIGAKIAKITVIHDDYVFKKCKDGNSQYLLGATIVVDEVALLSDQMDPSRSVIFSPEMIVALKPSLDVGELLSDKNPRYSAWCVYTCENTCDRYICIMDNSKIFVPQSMDASETVTVPNQEVKSPVVFIYRGMDPRLHVWVAYLCVFRKNTLVSKLPVGLNAYQTPLSAGAIELPSEIFANPWDMM